MKLSVTKHVFCFWFCFCFAFLERVPIWVEIDFVFTNIINSQHANRFLVRGLLFVCPRTCFVIRCRIGQIGAMINPRITFYSNLPGEPAGRNVPKKHLEPYLYQRRQDLLQMFQGNEQENLHYSDMAVQNAQ